MNELVPDQSKGKRSKRGKKRLTSSKKSSSSPESSQSKSPEDLQPNFIQKEIPKEEKEIIPKIALPSPDELCI